MSDENVSAEEARGHVGAWYPPVDGAAACYQVPRLARTVIALHDRVAEVEAERDEARRMLHREQENAAARERVLSRRVDALRASERATNEARRERDRLVPARQRDTDRRSDTLLTLNINAGIVKLRD